jgi:hypothetical protein
MMDESTARVWDQVELEMEDGLFTMMNERLPYLKSRRADVLEETGLDEDELDRVICLLEGYIQRQEF